MPVIMLCAPNLHCHLDLQELSTAVPGCGVTLPKETTQLLGISDVGHYPQETNWQYYSIHYDHQQDKRQNSAPGHYTITARKTSRA